MFSLLCLFFMYTFVYSLLVIDAGGFASESFSNISPRIVSGNVVNITKFPYAAYLSVFYNEDEETGTEEMGECTGVIIGEEWILTAAHCFKGNVIKSAYIRVGSTNKSSNEGMNLEVKRILKHPRNNNWTNDYDFALVRLKEKIVFSDTIDYIDLPTDDDSVDNDHSCWTAGWGHLSDPTIGNNYGLNETDSLYEVMLPIFNHSVCNDIYYKTLTRRMLCAGYELNAPPFKGPCLGDSGGPLVCERLLFGITSFKKIGEPCGKHPTVFGRVKSIRKWIADVTGIKPDSFRKRRLF